LIVFRVPLQVATAFVDGRLPKPSSLLLGSGGGTNRGNGYTPGPAVMVQVRFRSLFFRGGGWVEACVCRLCDGSRGGAGGGARGGGGRGRTGGMEAEGGGGGGGGGGSGGGAKENHERRAKLLADLGDGTVLVSWTNTDVEEVISSRRVLLSSSNSLTSRARRSLARNSLFRTMMSLGGDPGSGDSDSNGDGGLGIDDDPMASFSLSALSVLGALGGVGRGRGGGGGAGAGAREERSILNDILGQFIQSGNATMVR
ncbi:unnamed protein product, partial [Laminaria digitata]